MSRLLLGDYPKIGSLFQSPTPLCLAVNLAVKPPARPDEGARKGGDSFVNYGAGGQNRTADTAVFSRVLYP